MFSFINIVRALATCLITNSHFSPIYTYDIIAKGGALGNSLFFLATGFCLANCNGRFGNWYSKRLLRLYVPLLLVSGFYLCVGKNIVETVFFSYIFPQNYWFICALVILYPLYYLAVKYPFRNCKYSYTVVLILLYAIIYMFLDKSRYMVETVEFFAIRFSYIFSFFLMLVGAYLRKHFQEIREKLCTKRIRILFMFFVFIILYFGFILLMGRFKELYRIQYFETVLCILTSLSLFLFVMLFENDITDKKTNVFVRSFGFLGSCTLEIYLVQFPIINFVSELPFSSILKFIIAVSSILGCAYILKKISGYFIGKVSKVSEE